MAATEDRKHLLIVGKVLAQAFASAITKSYKKENMEALIEKVLKVRGWKRDHENDRAEHVVFIKDGIELLYCGDDNELVVIDETEEEHLIIFKGWIDGIEDLETVLRMLRV